MINTIYTHPDWNNVQESKENGSADSFEFFDDSGKIVYPFIKRNAGIVDGVQYYDLATARGECGPIVVEKKDDSLFYKWNTAFQQYCDENNIVAEYIRFDPWNRNKDYFEDLYDISDHGFVYCYKLQEDFFMTQYSSKRRNQVRKAMNSGLTVDLDVSWDKIDDFLKVYEHTVDKHSVSNYYLLDREFLMKYKDTFGEKARLGFVYLDDVIVSAGIFLNGGDIYHYHFSANHPDYVKLNAISYLLTEEAKLGAQDGCVWMDLGSATPGSGLEKFKKSMVKEEGILPCYVGTKIRNSSIYKALVEQNGGPREGFFPAYRG